MSLKISDLGLTEDLRALVTELKSSEIYFIEMVKDHPNPFQPDRDAPEIVYKADALSFVPVKTEGEAEYAFASMDEHYYQATIAMPPHPYKKMLGTHLYAVAIFSDGADAITGSVERLTFNLSSLVTVYIDAKEQIPFDPLVLGIVT
jgi:hypothetical protein